MIPAAGNGAVIPTRLQIVWNCWATDSAVVPIGVASPRPASGVRGVAFPRSLGALGTSIEAIAAWSDCSRAIPSAHQSGYPSDCGGTGTGRSSSSPVIMYTEADAAAPLPDRRVAGSGTYMLWSVPLKRFRSLKM